MKPHRQDEAPGVTDLVARLVDGLGHLVGQHVDLARIELGEEARALSRAVGTLALFVPLLVVGYSLLCFGVAFALEPLLTLPWAVLLVAAVNLLVGGCGLFYFRKTLKQPALEETSDALKESAEVLVAEAHREVSGVH